MWNLSTGVLVNGNQNIVIDNRLGLATGGLGNSASGAVVTGNENQIDGNVSAETTTTASRSPAT